MDIPVRVVEPSSAHTHTVVFLHGRGDNAANFERSLNYSLTSSGRTLFQALPSLRWVFPQAPQRKCASSAAVWPQWFDVWNTDNFAEREELQAEGLREVIPALTEILAAEAGRLGGRWDRVLLAGISMGGATGAHLLFNLDVPGPARGLAAFLGFSCRCPFAGRTLPQMRAVLGLEGAPGHGGVLQNTPMLLEHCKDDPLVLVVSGRGMRDTLTGLGAKVEWCEYENGGHWFNAPRGMDHVVEFVEKVVLGIGATVTAGEGGQGAVGEEMDLS